MLRSMELATASKAGITSRVKKLKERSLITPVIKADRDQLVKEAYIEYADEPIIIKRAKTLEKILNEMPIGIGDDELIVGNLSSGIPRAVGFYLEMSIGWKERELDRFPVREADTFFIDEEEKKKFRSLFDFWRGKTVEDRVLALMPEETKRFILTKNTPLDVNLHMNASGLGHIALGYNNVLDKGFEGILKEIETEKEKLDITDPDNLKKLWFLEAESIVCRAAIDYAKRYRKLAGEMAKNASGKRKKELEKISKTCDHVPAKPPRDFHEAMQSFFFIPLITQIETDGTGVSSGRFDQILYPYFKDDIESKKITIEQAQELVDCVWIKFNEILKVWDEGGAKSFGGFAMGQNLTIGGQTSDGDDATNELSYMCLKAVEDLQLPQPSLAVRIHQKTPEEFLLKISETLKVGTGLPAVHNDEVIIPSLLSRGFTIGDAYDYGLVGCVEPSKNGKDWPRANGGFLNFVKVLELALNDGVCLLTGERIGPETGDPVNFENYDDVLDAYKKQMYFLIKHCVIANNVIETAHIQMQPTPFQSTFTDNCIEKGKDITEGGALYNTTGPLGVGVANVADSLSAIKKMVFEDKVFSMEMMVKALRANYEGYEDIREQILNKAPKYGNDDDYADSIAKEICNIYFDELKKHKTTREAYFEPALIPVSANVPLGRLTAATPDGRKSGEPLAEGVSPGQGKDILGPTAVLKSVSKIEHVKAPIGILLNQKFNPLTIKGDMGTKKLANLLRGFVALGIQHIQFNVVSGKTLKKAQKNPEKYKNLVVRVAGYSAFFNDLDKTIQDDIINRTEQGL
jgi:formate C-acetyltransferase